MARPETDPFWRDISLSSLSGPRYRALAGVIERGIEQGRLRPGSKLPPQRDLAFDIGVTVGTVGRAYDLLVRQGRLRGEVGRGTFVCGQEASQLAGQIDQSEDDFRLGGSAERAGGKCLNLTVNMPIPTKAMAAMAEIVAELAASSAGAELMANYPPAQGVVRAREAACLWLEGQGVGVPLGQIIMTGGAQSAIAASLAAIGRAGEGVMLEALAFTRFATVARALGMRPEAISIDGDGLVPEALDAACRQGRGRILITSPAMNNPTGAFMPEERRIELAKIARLHDLSVIEDDVYGILADASAPKLSSLIPERTIFVTSLSKFIAPGLRTGMLAAPSRLADLIAAKHGNFAIASPAIASLAFAEAFQCGLINQAVELQQSAIAARQQLARAWLPQARIVSPQAVPHLWLELRDQAESDGVVAALAGRGIKVAAGRCFAVDPRVPVPFVRVSLGPLSEKDANRDLAQLAAGLSAPAIADMAI